MARPRTVTAAKRIEAAKAFTEGTRVRVIRSKYGNKWLQKDATGTVAPRQDWHQADIVEVWMDGDPYTGDDSWAWYPDELEVIR